MRVEVPVALGAVHLRPGAGAGREPDRSLRPQGRRGIFFCGIGRPSRMRQRFGQSHQRSAASGPAAAGLE